MIDDIFHSATDAELRQGLEWYVQAHAQAQAIAQETGIPLGAVAGVIAALSPANKWERNITEARSFIVVYVEGGDPLLVKTSTYKKNAQRAVTILAAGDYRGVVDPKKCPKVYNFACNIEYPEGDEITIDRHAYNAFVGERAIKNADGPRVTLKRYREAAADYRRLARAEGLRPNQVQAVVWGVWRRLLGLTP